MVSASEIRANKCAYVRVGMMKAVILWCRVNMLLCDSDMSFQH